MKRYGMLLPALSTALLVTAGCSQNEDVLLLFEAPSDAAVLPAGSIFDVTTAYVANARSGDIAKLNVTDRTYLGDGDAAAILRGTVVPTGTTRLLEQIAVFSSDQLLTNPEDESFVTFFATDSVRQTLLVVPYLDSSVYLGDSMESGLDCIYGDPDNAPLLPKYPICYAYETSFTASDGGQSPAVFMFRGSVAVPNSYLTDVVLKDGETTTETWSVIYDAEFERFAISGTVSGQQSLFAYPGEAYVSDNGALGFTLEIEDSLVVEDGDNFELRTDNGILEFPVDGIVQDIAVDENSGLLVFTAQNDDGLSHLYAVDAQELRKGSIESLLPAVTFESGALAGRLDLVAPVESCEEAGYESMDYSRLFIADSGELGRTYQIDLEGVTVEEMASSLKTVDLGFPNVDVALSRNPCVPYLYVAERDISIDDYEVYGIHASRVRMWDVANELEVDPNPYTPYITAEQCASNWCPTACEDTCNQAAPGGDIPSCIDDCMDSCSEDCETEGIQVNSPIKGLAASLGPVELNTVDNKGVALTDYVVGVTTYAGSLYTIEASRGCLSFMLPSGAYATETNIYPQDSETFNHSMFQDSETGRTALGSACGGITRSESWDIVYDSLVGAWRVRGSQSGNQVGLALTDVRYISDGSEVSFMILSGTQPALDGDWIRISVEDGVANVTTDDFESLQDLTVYQESRGNNGEAWYEQSVQNGAVMVIRGRDFVTVYDLAPANIPLQPLATYN